MADLCLSPAPPAAPSISARSCFSPPSLFHAIAPIDSPPDSPATPWRPGSTAYPPPYNTPVRDDRVPHPSPSPNSHNGKLELQKLCESLSENAYDLSLRDIVELPHSLYNDGHVAPSPASSFPSTVTSTTLKEELSRASDVDASESLLRRNNPAQLNDSISTSSPTPKCRISLRFGFLAARREPGCRVSEERKRISLPSPAEEDNLVLLRVRRRCHRRSARKASPSPSSASPSPSPARKSSTASCRRSMKPQLDNQQRHNSPSRRSMSAVGQTRRRPTDGMSRSRESSCSPASHNHPSRVHPSTQCSSCGSYTVFFKSRCSACGKLYCSNCAKDAMHAALDGQRCRDNCGRVLSNARFSASLRSRWWPLCCNVDVTKMARK